jgi:dihydrofolate reductase
LGYVKVAILGGAQTYQYCLDRGLLDEIYLTIEPLTFSSGINLFSSVKPKIRKWNLVAVKKLNRLGTILLHYRRAGV